MPNVHPLVALRRSCNLTLRRLDSKTGINFRRLALFEQGLRPRPHEIDLLAEALGVEPRTLCALLGESHEARVWPAC
jgi:transcriptional regulator with XRE-family HTH domain